MKFFIILASLLAFASPALAECHRVTTVTGVSDQANHQSSLSSTTAGGAVTTTHCVCTPS